ncbi:MAG TPA: 30S ribosomal protein S3ae [Candidatus Acidoferrales bacterium]|nr:30S ribosomal protein S3ae [Candidatus Acidoferrales bacterium]
MSKATKKVRDKWRLKEWYDVYSPPYFGENIVASIPCEVPSAVIGRVVETTLYDITNDFAHQSIKLYFLVANVKDHRADTILKSHEYATDYLRSLVRRGSTRLDGIFNATTKDQFSTRISIVAFTRDRINASQEHGVRHVMRQVVDEKATALNYDQLSQEVVLGKLGSDIYNLSKKIAPLRHVGVRKSKLLSIPPGVMATQAQIMEQVKATAA